MARVRKEARALTALSKRFSGHRPADDVFEIVTGVPTCFVQYDFATRVGGHPVCRVGVLHGPSSEGKSVFMLGLAGSFLSLDHFAKVEDAERTTDKVWVRKLIGNRLKHPRFYAERPKNYEHAIADVRNFATDLMAARAAKEIPEDTYGFVGVDSMKKLVPKNLMKEILEGDALESDIKVHDRRAQRQASINNVWLDELVPLADDAKLAVLLIAREYDDPDADEWKRKAGQAYKVAGGKGLNFDASIRFRIERDRWVGEKAEKDDKGRVVSKGAIYGERHRLTIIKTKIGEKDDRVTVCYFHTSNGNLPGVPFGFDRARDVLDLALRFNLVKQAGSSYSFQKRRLGQGEHNVVRRLTADTAMLDEIEAECRSLFFKPGYDPETGEVTE